MRLHQANIAQFPGPDPGHHCPLQQTVGRLLRTAVGRCSKPRWDNSETTGADDDETPTRTTARGPWEPTPGPDAGKRGRNDGELGSLHRSCTNSSPPHRLTTRSVTWSRATIKRATASSPDGAGNGTTAKDHRGDLGSDRARTRPRRDEHVLARPRTVETSGPRTGPQARVRRPDPGAGPHPHARAQCLQRLPAHTGLRPLRLLAGHPRAAARE